MQSASNGRKDMVRPVAAKTLARWADCARTLIADERKA